MTRRLAVFAFIGAFSASSLFGDNPKNDANARDLKELQGKWVGEWLVVAGKKCQFSDLGFSCAVVFNGDSMTLEFGAGGETRLKQKCSAKLDATKVPRFIDITGFEDEEKLTPAIYALEGENLKLCTPEPGGRAMRPTELTSTADNSNTLVLLKRSK